MEKLKLIKSLALVLPVSIAQVSVAETLLVSVATDDGTGLVAGTFSAAILAANQQPGADTIVFNTDIQITGVMKRLIDSDVTITSAGPRKVIDGNHQFRPIFVKSGTVVIDRIELTNGGAIGLDGGAGLGGSIFVYDGNVTLQSSLITQSSVSTAVNNTNRVSGGGMFGAAAGKGGGGLFTSSDSNQGAYGGYGQYQNGDQFGQGGTYIYEEFNLINGGFGAGGAYGKAYYGSIGGDGGFGGGGGRGSSIYTYDVEGGKGGFGGAAGSVDYGGVMGQPGYGAEGTRYGASLGGGLFIRSGEVNIAGTTFSNNQAIGSTGPFGDSKGLGGAIFVLHTTQNSNYNHQGMPTTLADVYLCGVNFENNSATHDASSANNNNDDVFDLADRINYVELCGFELIFEDGFD